MFGIFNSPIRMDSSLSMFDDDGIVLSNVGTSSNTELAELAKGITFTPIDEEYKQNYYKDRIKMNEKSHLLSTKTRFEFHKVYPPNSHEEMKIGAEDFKSKIIEEVEYFKKDPKYGFFEEDFKLDLYNQQRKSIAFLKYTPSIFQKKTNLPPLKPFECYTSRESIISIHQLNIERPASITLINIQNINLYNVLPHVIS